ncbi:MAG: fibronectin type III domain-containing protein [Candidatus Desantisbacteria bacterium]
MKKLILAVLFLGISTCCHAEMNVRLSNLTDSGVILSWISDGTGTCKVNYGMSAGSMTMTGYDIRGSKTVSRIHFVAVTDLNPLTTYYYQPVFNDKQGMSGTFTTNNSLVPSGSYLAYGRVLDGYKPAVNCMVSLWLEDGDGKGNQDKSGVASCLTDENGYWFYDMVNLRTQDGKGLFKFSEQGDLLYLDVNAENGIVVKTRMDTGGCMPARDVYLK